MANEDESTGSAEGVSLLTMNLRFGLANDGENRWENRREAVADLIRTRNPDLICLQEANDFQITDLDSRLSGYHHIGRRTPAPRFWQNNVIFYRPPWQCTCRDHFYLSWTPSIPSRFPESRWPRQCTFGTFQDRNRRLLLVNTHFDFTPGVQRDSARLICRRLAGLPGNPPTLLAGDFNAVPESPGYRVFTDAEALGTNVFRNAFEPPYPATHHGFTGKKDGRHIDWVLYRGPLAAVQRQVIDGKVMDVYPSDHFPLFCRFAWTPATMNPNRR